MALGHGMRPHSSTAAGALVSIAFLADTKSLELKAIPVPKVFLGLQA